MNAVIYVRASSSSPDAHVLVDQIAACGGLCERNGWAVIGIFYDTSSGSGTLAQKKRTGLHALLAIIEQGDIDYVVIETADRIARDRIYTSAIQEDIERAGAQLVSVSDSDRTGIADTILALFDTAFRDDWIARIKRGTHASVSARRADLSK
ncbi:recombinase family protein [Sphingomonas sp. TX0543]|uniref:recombinase family protein n=1 Tax=Sphingomonas sp. TX0543 TaxID=3399682 RepID=UPI00148586A0